MTGPPGSPWSFGLYEEPPIYTASGDFVPPDNGMLLKVGQFNTHIQPS